MIVVAPPKFNEVNAERNTLAIEPITIMKSKIFQLSLKYILPKPIILMTASNVKIAVKT